MNPARIAKIKALAEDARGDPATRARAQEKLTVLRTLHPHLFEAEKPKFHNVQQDPRVHGMRRDQAYEYYIFTDLSLWGETKAGNKVHHAYHKGIIYRIVLFQHHKTPTWGWMRINDTQGGTVFSQRFGTMEEAHADAWANLMLV